jgi:plastocyanin
MVRPGLGRGQTAARGRPAILCRPNEEEDMRRFVFVLVPLLVFALTACGSDGGRTTGSTGATAAGSDAGESGTAGPPAATGATSEDCEDLTGEGAVFTIKISFSTFYPDCFTASASQSIKIVNKDDIDHTFTIPGTQVDVPVAADETFNGEPIAGAIEPGTYEFQCTIHPQMTGRVTVVA